MTTHTLENLMTLSHKLTQKAINKDRHETTGTIYEYNEANIALSLALSEVLAELEEMKAEVDNVKQVQFPAKLKKVAENWQSKCAEQAAEIERLTEERDMHMRVAVKAIDDVVQLKAKIAAMESQEPRWEVAEDGLPYPINHSFSDYAGTKLYLAPGAAPKDDA